MRHERLRRKPKRGTSLSLTIAHYTTCILRCTQSRMLTSRWQSKFKSRNVWQLYILTRYHTLAGRKLVLKQQFSEMTAALVHTINVFRQSEIQYNPAECNPCSSSYSYLLSLRRFVVLALGLRDCVYDGFTAENITARIK